MKPLMVGRLLRYAHSEGCVVSPGDEISSYLSFEPIVVWEGS